RQISQRRRDDALMRRRAFLDQRRRPVARQPVLDQFRAELRQRAEPHVDDQRLPAARELIPMQLELAVLARVTGHEDAGLRVSAMREWNSRIGRTAVRRGDAGNDLERNPLRSERLDLLATA